MVTTLRKIFAENVKFYRKQSKLTQAQLAEKCGIATNYLGEIEQEKKFPSVEVIEAIAAELGIPEYILFIRESEISQSAQNAISLKFTQKKKELICTEISDAVTKILEKY